MLRVDDCTAARWRLEVVDAQEHSWVTASAAKRGLGTWEEDSSNSLKLWSSWGRFARTGVKQLNHPEGSEW